MRAWLRRSAMRHRFEKIALVVVGVLDKLCRSCSDIVIISWLSRCRLRCFFFHIFCCIFERPGGMCRSPPPLAIAIEPRRWLARGGLPAQSKYTGAGEYNRPCAHQICSQISVMHGLQWPINSTRIVDHPPGTAKTHSTDGQIPQKETEE